MKISLMNSGIALIMVHLSRKSSRWPMKTLTYWIVIFVSMAVPMDWTKCLLMNVKLWVRMKWISWAGYPKVIHCLVKYSKYAEMKSLWGVLVYSEATTGVERVVVWVKLLMWEFVEEISCVLEKNAPTNFSPFISYYWRSISRATSPWVAPWNALVTHAKQSSLSCI